MSQPTLYTIGHSNQTQESFLEMLNTQAIQVVVDVRSVPASKYTPQFNREPLSVFLKAHQMNYLFFGYEFGARRDDALDADGRVDFEKAATTPAFLQGVERIKKGLQAGYKMAFMCSEGNPLECHRFALVGRYFFEHGFEVQHLMRLKGELNDEQIITRLHKSLQDEMVADYVRKKKIPALCPPDIFGENECTEPMQIAAAYRQKNKEIAYQVETTNNPCL